MNKVMLKRMLAFLLFIALVISSTAYGEVFTARYRENEINDKKILELGKDPGLSIRKLHKEGITGKGVGIAILDNYLLKDHVEYKDRLKKYISLGGAEVEHPELHGTATASLAVGKTVGVAPEADLYFLEDGSIEDSNDFGLYVYKAVKEVISINKQLSKENRIRVISYSGSVASVYPDYKSYRDALELAKKEGIFFISTSMKHYGFYHAGLERTPESDPNNYLSYKPFSWEVPYIAGLYVLACQVNPKVTPELFWEKALETGYPVLIDKGYGEDIKGKIVNPTKLYKALKK